jgi:hypothetical protein
MDMAIEKIPVNDNLKSLGVTRFVKENDTCIISFDTDKTTSRFQTKITQNMWQNYATRWILIMIIIRERRRRRKSRRRVLVLISSKNLDYYQPEKRLPSAI